MGDDRIREEIAFIRSALEEGRAYAHLRSPDFTVWGALMALGYLATYGSVTGFWSIGPGAIWWSLVALGWLFSLRGVWNRGRREEGPSVQALRALWLGFGVTALLFAVLPLAGSGRGEGLDVLSSGLLGLAFFVSATISRVSWLRLVAAGWWGAAIVFFLLHGRAEALLAGAGFMIVLLCLPGLVLWLRRPGAHG